MSETIDSYEFYSQFHGHPVHHLKILHDEMRRLARYSHKDREAGIIWTAGDSSLDNKYWFSNTMPAVPGAYENKLYPQQSKCDVVYWMNYILYHEQNQTIEPSFIGAINSAVEATTLNQRRGGLALTEQDKFLRDNIQSNDVLVVSIGGNDVALSPTPCTIASMLGLICVPQIIIENGCSLCTCPLDDYCCGCTTSVLSCMGSFPPCLGYFSHLFGSRVENYLKALTTKTKPSKVLVCMIYNPDENNVPSWAGSALSALQYNTKPEKLQAIIRKEFYEATSRILVPGVDEVIPVPLFSILDGKSTEDYVARVEPSSIGGRKIASFILNILIRKISHKNTQTQSSTTPLIIDRS